MPNYLFSNVKTGETRDIFYTMKAVPKVGSVIRLDGGKWRREFTLPQAAVNGIKAIDPYSQKAFRDKTGAMKGTIGEMWDLSKEMSERRAEKEGTKDPVKQKYFADYRKRKRGTPHTAELAESQKDAKTHLEKGLRKLGITPPSDMAKLGKIS